MLITLTVVVLLLCTPHAVSGIQSRRQPSSPDPAARRGGGDRRRADSRPASPSAPSQAETNGGGGSVDDENDEVVRVDSNLVPLPASVIDAHGRAITDLKLTDFELQVDGELRPIKELTRADTPVRLALLFDNSSSLTSARKFEKQAAVRFVKDVLRPVDRAALYSVATEPVLVRPLTNDSRALVRAIESFDKPRGATALFEAIAQAAEYLRPFRGRKVIVIVSDGVDTISDISFDETLRLVLAADCQIYAVQTGHSDNPNLRDLTAERRLQEFAAQTGGGVYTPKGTADLDRAFAQISADLAQQYVLSYYPVGERRDGRFHVFTLRVRTRADARVRTRKGYYAPKG